MTLKRKKPILRVVQKKKKGESAISAAVRSKQLPPIGGVFFCCVRKKKGKVARWLRGKREKWHGSLPTGGRGKASYLSPKAGEGFVTAAVNERKGKKRAVPREENKRGGEILPKRLFIPKEAAGFSRREERERKRLAVSLLS